MEDLHIRATSTTPEIKFNAAENLLQIRGISVPENVNQIYSAALAWVDKCCKTCKDPIELQVSLSYFNTSSSKALLSIFLRLAQHASDTGQSNKIKWYYEDDDQDMYEAGLDYQQIVPIPMELISVKNLNEN